VCQVSRESDKTEDRSNDLKKSLTSMTGITSIHPERQTGHLHCKLCWLQAELKMKTGIATELCHVEKFPIEPGKIAVGLHKQE